MLMSAVVRLVDPTTAPAPAGFRPATRAALERKRLGVLANGKLNSDRLLLAVAERVRAARGLAEIVSVHKPSAFQPAPPELFADLRERVDAMVTGVGD
jgi:hypothetical protein